MSKEDHDYKVVMIKNHPRINTLLRILIVVGIVAVILTGVQYHSDVKTDLHLTRHRVDSLSTINSEYVKKTSELSEQITQLKKTPIDTSGDAILEHDIFVYIDKKFQIVPKTASVEIAKQIVEQAREHEVAPELVVGIIQVESAFNPSAISKANARGLMQVMPEWAPKFGLKKVSDLHDIDTGIECGIKVLKIHIDEENGNLTKGLYKYVGGSDAYASKVYTAMGKFVAYRSSITNNGNDKEGDPDQTDKS